MSSPDLRIPPVPEFSPSRLRALRDARSMTRKDLASAINRSPWSVMDWEYGNTCPRMSILPRLAHALDCSIEDLFEVPPDAWTDDDRSGGVPESTPPRSVV